MTEKNVLEGVLDHLQTMISSNILLSDPVESGNRSIFTISSVGFGFGGGEGKSEDGGGGAGAGAGAGVTPIAVMVIHKDIPGAEGVQIFTLGKKGEVAQAISTAAESLPSVIDALRSPKKE
ncbi:hypothetical protein RJ53_10250 [Methanocalculus chunghsingensis]|uniref:Sporulation protein YtfJ n=1 Tax=Methanocalculus chunghsingensis TaxID=156457 RepID=A0A8J8B7M8_9EURY|nr:spore germination protein GerW family protein [Methanocalculus chunghsingensis]MBR1369837.1 hypothetical protein [Methanocalculus chunghsingensis]